MKLYKLTIFLITFTTLLISACTTVVPGVPVKDYLASQDNLLHPASSSADKEGQFATLEQFSQVTSNEVFTEKGGIPEYLIGPQDGLEITSWAGTKPTVYKTAVRQDGTISYSFIDDITVAGLTPREADQLITKLLKHYVKEVRIDLAVKKYVSKRALLFGEINILQTGRSGPGRYPLTGKTSILDLIVAAGGATKDADLKNVELVRKGTRYPINLYAAMFQGDMRQNIIVDNGDIITVPDLPKLAERIYVFGEVNHVGVYALDDAVDLMAALGLAGGFTPLAIEKDVKIIRGYDHRKKPVVLAANLDEILKKGDISQNVKLINGDVVYVPRHAIGDLNDFITNTTPLLDYMLYPSTYRDQYSNPDNLRFFK